MTAIKPPNFTGPTATDLPSDASRAISGSVPGSSSGVAGPEKAAPSSFTQALGQANAAQGAQGAQGTQGTAATGRADAISTLARELEAGALSPEQAVDRLVERATQSLERSLSPSERADLLSVLRSALASDPALAALRDALG